ncbi:MAG: CHASE2 domain-containing protein, partial [Magnetococcales bacterium]|nr:CHASE2 domain-containing protein [Magnetococcales bacterium]
MTKLSSQSAAFWQWIFSMVLIAFFCLHLWQVFPLGVLTWVENFSYDLRLSLAPQQEMDQRIHIVTIDEKSLQEVGRWPWSRNHMAKLVRHLFDHYRVNVLALDMVFAEPDHSSGLQVLEGLAEKELRGDPGFQERMEQLRVSLAYDHVLAQSLQGKPVVLGFVLHNETTPPNPRQQLPKPLLDLWETGHTKTTLPASENFIGNLEILQN